MSFTRNEVAQHNTADDCWVILNGDVLDLSQFSVMHPGKTAHTYAAGKEAAEFMGKINGGKGHPSGAFEWAKSFKIGTLAEQ